MAKLKVRHKLKSTKRKPTLNEINELSLSVFIIKRDKANELRTKINELGAKILSETRGVGVSRSSIFESLKVGNDDVSVFFTIIRVEDVKDYMQSISEEFNFAIPGNGKGFTIDIDGYLGAKALFIE